MEREQNNSEGTIGRWLRVGILTTATLAPIVNTMIERARERSQALRQLKETPYAQELLKRSNDLTGTLTEQGSKLGQVLAERGSDLSERGSKLGQVLVERGAGIAGQSGKTAQAMLERGSQVSRDLAQRSERVSKEVAQRGQKATKEIVERGSQVTSEFTENPFVFWATFGVGLLAAGITTYLLMQKRLRRRNDEEQLIQLEQSGSQNGFIKVQTGSGKAATHDNTETETQAAGPAVAVAEEPVEQEHPAGTRFLGVVGNKRYYPVETPLAQLPRTEDGKLDVVYFTSEDEAKAQGFSAAE